MEDTSKVLQNVKHSYHVTQQLHSRGYTQKRSKHMSTYKTTRQRSEQCSHTRRVKQLKCLLAEECMAKICSIPIMEY